MPVSLPTRLAMSFPLLKILSHRIACTNWSNFSKQVLYTVFCVCFFTSCRMGEIVCESSTAFDPRKTLKWENVFFGTGEITFFLPYTKTTGFKGALVDFFEIKNFTYCPYKAFISYYNLSRANKDFSLKNPVFRFKSGEFLSTAKLNSILNDLMHDYCNSNSKITCHSFRAAIPTLLASHPSNSSVSDILEWGRWTSDCYMKYTRHDKIRKKFVYDKIVSFLE